MPRLRSPAATDGEYTVGRRARFISLRSMQELHERKILPVLISYTVPYPNMVVDSDGWDWIKVALRSFHDHFDGQKVLVVDNDKDDEAYEPKRDWLYSYPGGIVVRNPITRDPRFW